MKSAMKALTFSAASGAIGVAAWHALRQKSRFNLKNKVVLITGASRGLGLRLAQEFGDHGAIVVICSRDKAELDRASEHLRRRGIRVHTAVCDISDQAQANDLVQNTIAKAGGIDVLVNNAGVIEVGPVSAMTTADFEKAMNVIFWGTLYPTLAAIPEMRARHAGRIVNITSIGGKVSVPHLLPYCCAKFAAVGLSEGLRAELIPDGIKVTTVVPGLMRTGSHLKASFKGRQAWEYVWFSLGAASPLTSISADRAARSIVDATIRGDAERILSIPAQVAARLHGIAPEFTANLMTFVNRLLPSGDGSASGYASGAEARAKLNSRILNTANLLGERAAEVLNQLA